MPWNVPYWNTFVFNLSKTSTSKCSANLSETKHLSNFSNPAKSTSATLPYWHLLFIIISKKVWFWRKSDSNKFMLPLSLYSHLFSFLEDLSYQRCNAEKCFHTFIILRCPTDLLVTFLFRLLIFDIIWPSIL